MKAQLKQIIELLDADERLALLYYLMQELPPSAVKDTYDSYQDNQCHARMDKVIEHYKTDRPEPENGHVELDYMY